MNTRARLVQLKGIPDDRGLLVIGESGQHQPFVTRRFFVIRDVPVGASRGAHAHRECEQLVVVLSGSCRISLIDAQGKDDLTLGSPLDALYVPTMVWLETKDFAPGTVMLVLASHGYDPDDYIRSLREFLLAIAKV